jgi:hypothetical protein
MSEKKERPILFSTPMVQALLNGTKTQTRRVVKDSKDFESVKHKNIIDEELGPLPEFYAYEKGNMIKMANCPYGKVGDILYVKETHCIFQNEIVYKASNNLAEVKWTPSLLMKKAAARIFLEITEIKVERVKDISEEDAIAEGIEQKIGKNGANEDTLFRLDYLSRGYIKMSAAESFKTLWWSINGGESYHANPWVWVVKFKVIKP